jgi:hypothetical protein
MVREDEMDRACTIKGEIINVNNVLVSQHKRKGPLGKPWHRGKKNDKAIPVIGRRGKLQG